MTTPTVPHGTLFRFATAGSVDDGKSTLVGRLLHDSKAILADTLDAVARTSADRGFGGEAGGLDLALLTDGLRAEREQGITIDVAYRYFATDKRTFILADCPGHVQYTKNTVTGASTADAVVLLVDARHGVLEQTRRHLSVAALLRVPHVVVAVNKIDLIGYAQDRFAEISGAIEAIAAELGLESVASIPVSALEGDNVVHRSEHTPWYAGPTLVQILETLPGLDAAEAAEHATEAGGSLRFPVQYVIRPQGALAAGLDEEEYRDYRGYAGQLASGHVGVGDTVSIIAPGQGRRTTTVAGIDTADGPLQRAIAPASVTLRLAEDIDIARGDLIASGFLPTSTDAFTARLAWLGAHALRPGARVLIKHGAATVKGLVTAINGRLDLDSLEIGEAETLELNDIGEVGLKLAAPLPLEPYAAHRRTGAFLVIDPQDGNTLAAGLVA
ncbi:GTP-binding protein [Arthrobacter ginkgonis]|uniref:sulfate adenylyltransferase n=1 Tax=Arthrobacter ginkgonis TaxID=1630594 RepID=A0ABP7CFJ6_9MICC